MKRTTTDLITVVAGFVTLVFTFICVTVIFNPIAWLIIAAIYFASRHF